MPFMSALGLGVAILVLKCLTPMIFSEIETTAILYLQGAQTGARAATQLAGAASMITIENHPLALPRAPQVRNQ